jgi:hypothetical protein
MGALEIALRQSSAAYAIGPAGARCIDRGPLGPCRYVSGDRSLQVPLTRQVAAEVTTRFALWRHPACAETLRRPTVDNLVMRRPVRNEHPRLVAGGASSSVYDAVYEISPLRRSSTT